MTRKKTRKKKNNSKVKKDPTRNLLIGVILGTIILLLLIIFHQMIFGVKVKENTLLKTIIHVTPIPTASPSIIPTPTPEPKLVGFCLKVPILLYHHIEPIDQANKKGYGWMTVDPVIFEQQLSYLNSHGYLTISAEELVQALINKRDLPPNSILLTADDGYKDIFDFAFPIIQKYNIKFNLMIPTGLMNNQGYLSWGELKQMTGSGLVTVYNHTWSHASLGNASKEKIEYEIVTSKKQLEGQLGKDVKIFAYPYGSESNLVREVLQLNGFSAALSTISGYYQCDSFIMSLHRNRIGNTPLASYGL